ncbi:MAG: B12-binding domain-containing radical SAM protein [Deltaproteobacteria bacterium]|nr:B12-binding domain-containing radical SAM protein [Deltaproteobacteria bacterium]
MQILLLMPDAHMHKLRFGSFVRSSREAPLTLTTLAALTGDDPDLHYRIVDESIDRVPLDATPDLVGISVMTGTSRRAYALADHFRRRGIKVVLGGVHVSLIPDEARKYADSIVIGMGDKVWPQVVADARAGRLAPEYRAPVETSDFYADIPTPRYDLLRHMGYNLPYTVPFTRGCVHACDFCTVPAVWPRFQKRPIADIVRDIEAVPAKLFAVNDVSPFDDVDWAKELLRAMIPLKKKWGGLATTSILRDPELVELIAKSGCKFLLFGFESVNQQSLKGIYKTFNKEDEYAELMKVMHRYGIIVQGCFVFGFDEDRPDVFERTVARVQALKIDIPRYSIYTPYPGTRLFQRLQSEGRILSYDWGDYDTMHVVFRPRGMSPVELYDGFRWAYRETFKISSIAKRVVGSGWWFPVTFVGNLTYRIFVKRLYAGHAFDMPVNQRAPEGVRGAWQDRGDLTFVNGAAGEERQTG